MNVNRGTNQKKQSRSAIRNWSLPAVELLHTPRQFVVPLDTSHWNSSSVRQKARRKKVEEVATKVKQIQAEEKPWNISTDRENRTPSKRVKSSRERRRSRMYSCRSWLSHDGDCFEVKIVEFVGSLQSELTIISEPKGASETFHCFCVCFCSFRMQVENSIGNLCPGSFATVHVEVMLELHRFIGGSWIFRRVGTVIYEKINSRFVVDFLPNRDQQKNNLIYGRNSRRSRSQSPRFKFMSGVFDSSMENATLNSTRWWQGRELDEYQQPRCERCGSGCAQSKTSKSIRTVTTMQFE